MHSTFEIAGRRLGAGSPCLVIAEVAQAHDGSVNMAHAFIDAAAEAGADAIKFQTHIAEAESTAAEQWRVKFSHQDASRYDYWRRMEFSPGQWAELYRHARQRNLLFLSTPFSEAAANLLSEIGVDAWKVASGELSNIPLLEHLGTLPRPFLISTGMSGWAEIDKAVAAARNTGNPTALFQCTSMYPTPPEKVGLNVLSEMRKRYGCPVGLSDHTGRLETAVAAAVHGINLLEVHVTFHKRMFGPDVPASLTFEELATAIRMIRYVESMNANPVDKDAVAAELAPMRNLFTKSIVAARDLRAGAALARSDLALKKPGNGMSADRLPSIIGRRLSSDVARDTQISDGHLL